MYPGICPFFITRLFYLDQIAAETSSNLFSMDFFLYEKCMSSIFPYKWCMEMYDKHFRFMEINLGIFSGYSGQNFFPLPRKKFFHFLLLEQNVRFVVFSENNPINLSLYFYF